jgi:hypothetical protein
MRRERATLEHLLEDAEVLERSFRVEDRASELKELLGFQSNLNRPIHRWYNFKEGFGEGLVHWLLDKYPRETHGPIQYLDPFCGVGTSLLGAQDYFAGSGLENARVQGVEVNTYMHFVSMTKVRWHNYNPAFLLRAAEVSTNGLKLRGKPEIPALSTFANEKYIARTDLARIVDLRNKIQVVARKRPEMRPLLLGLMSGAERVFNLRKDGRALRFVERARDTTVDEEMKRAWKTIAEDLQLGLQWSGTPTRVVKGDGRRADKLFEHGKFDVILFSPPYLNNIDYTEVYKIEQWLLGFLTSQRDMVAQRRKTFQSHPSCVFPSFADAEHDAVVGLLGDRFKRLVDYAAEGESWRNRLFAGYFADMHRTLQSCMRLLKPGGRVFLVVGNSLHGDADRPIPVATDIWIGKLARKVGLRVDAILVGRELQRRKLEWSGLRESVLVMTKPKA